ncbi:hypothetical protein BDV24DRAFT_160334 [Aspergillus arachidicola]|uniref:Nudix hydrolase domain-containing protein n=1 Tax=Aspergillus arachidicola TaxID=656916 RepID=A0A5N6YGK2_9EURO|nr:hypothetical protein BDV24DRAFT_160334 [Aspergillus arachidicola]
MIKDDSSAKTRRYACGEIGKMFTVEHLHYGQFLLNAKMTDNLSILPYNSQSPIDQFEIRTKSYLLERTEIFGVVGAAIIIHNNQVLLIQRASDDDHPNLWEVPGGEAHGEETIVHCAVRELREEAGLDAPEVIDMIGEFEWVECESARRESEERVWKIFMFLMKVGDDTTKLEIKLDPKEHRAYLWATEAQVRESLCGTTKLEWMSINQRQAILSAFERANS